MLNFGNIQILICWPIEVSSCIYLNRLSCSPQLSLFGLAFSRPQVLKSQLPSKPIEDPDLWAWGQHPNGLGYKAPNDLLFETCLSTPNSPLCYEAASSRQCWENASILRTCMCARHTPTTACTNVGAPVRGKVTE